MTAALLLAAVVAAQSAPALRLHVRVFDGASEVTAETRVVLYKAGERQGPVAQATGGQGLSAAVAPGLYDAQAIRERDGKVVNIRWAERLVVMPYPDEAGDHLEIINFDANYGALEVRGRGHAAPAAALYAAGSRTTEAGHPVGGAGYALFVVPAGTYDLRLGEGSGITWHAGIDVPRDRTRFWVVP